MQIVEATDFGVRAVVLQLRRKGSPLKFTLFPMVHVGTPEYFAEVESRVARCDLAVVEGIRGESTTGRLLTATYRVSTLLDRNGLVLQDLRLSELGIPLVCPDMTGAELDKGWRRIPLAQRLAVLSQLPVAFLFNAAFATRADLAEHLSVDDDTYLTVEDFQSVPDLEELIVDERDRLLVKALADLHERRSGEDIDIAVVYGAGHLPAVIHSLNGLFGYVVRKAEFITIFDL